jgi:D-amino peptidase
MVRVDNRIGSPISPEHDHPIELPRPSRCGLACARLGRVKVYVSVDMEGVAGIADWEQCLPGGDDYALGRDLVLGEVNAAIDGAVAAGAVEILVNDSHSVMRNLPPDALGGRASYLSGRFKPLYMMEGLDPSYDAVVFLGYHAAMQSPGVLSHTYNPRAIAEVRLNAVVTGEAGLNALVAQHHGVPVAVITGDQYVGPEVASFCPGIEAIEVKRSVSRYAAEHLHPEAARERIREGVASALRAVLSPPGLSPPRISVPATVEVELLSPDMAEQATWIHGITRLDGRTVSFTDDDPLRLFRTFMTLVFLTRSLVEPR